MLCNQVCLTYAAEVAKSGGKRVKAKKKCCRDKPRCKSCPVVLKRLADAGYAERKDPFRFIMLAKPSKKVVAAARAR